MLKKAMSLQLIKFVSGVSRTAAEGHRYAIAASAIVTKVFDYYPQTLLTWVYFSESLQEQADGILLFALFHCRELKFKLSATCHFWNCCR